jgi:hypothetical protein
MHTVFFGGMGQYWFEEAAGQIREDNLVPFIDDIAALSRAANGSVTETVLAARMPGYFGSNAHLFVEPAAPAWPNGVLRVESLPGRTLVAYIHGGITTDRPHPGWTMGPSEASTEVFAVYVTPQPLANEDSPTVAGLALSAPLPNPAVTTARMTLTLARAGDVRVEIFDAVGRLVATLHAGALPQGDHVLELDAAGLVPGVYMVRAAGSAGAVTHRVAVTR